MNPDRDVTTLAVGGSGDRLAALVAGTVDATPLDVAYVEKAEKLGLVSVIYFGDVVHTRLGGFGVSHGQDSQEPGANRAHDPRLAQRRALHPRQ